jgi:hypothetical protein
MQWDTCGLVKTWQIGPEAADSLVRQSNRRKAVDPRKAALHHVSHAPSFLHGPGGAAWVCVAVTTVGPVCYVQQGTWLYAPCYASSKHGVLILLIAAGSMTPWALG